MFEVSDLLHFVAFSTGVDKENVGVDNVKALELTNSIVFNEKALELDNRIFFSYFSLISM